MLLNKSNCSCCYSTLFYTDSGYTIVLSFLSVISHVTFGWSLCVCVCSLSLRLSQFLCSFYSIAVLLSVCPMVIMDVSRIQSDLACLPARPPDPMANGTEWNESKLCRYKY
jgi:hypothetical protein